MSTTIVRQEDFPIENLRYLERRIGEIRKTVMNNAAKIAEKADPKTKSYVVEKCHIDEAFREFFHDQSK